MDVQNILNSRFGAYFAIIISRTFSPSMGYGFGKMVARLLTVFHDSNLIRSLRANQWVIHGERDNKHEQIKKARSVLSHAARCYYDFYNALSEEQEIQTFVPHTSEIQDFLRKTREAGGTLVVAPHLSNFDLVIQALATYGFQAKILTLENPRGAYRVQNKIRASSGLDITPLQETRVYLEAIEHLKRGGIAATAIDRPVPNRKSRHSIQFFGKPSALPVGHISMALAADVPVTVVAAKMSPAGTYHLLHTDPLPLQRYAKKIDTVIKNAEMILKKIEAFILQAPEQWLMYYPVWPQIMDELP